MAGNDIRRLPWMDVRTDVDAIVAESDRPFPYQVDGDHLGDTLRLELRHRPAALRLVRPG